MTHVCHWPDCREPVPPAMWGCKEHWFALPYRIRKKISATYRPGQEISKTPSREYVDAALEARAWINHTIAARKDLTSNIDYVSLHSPIQSLIRELPMSETRVVLLAMAAAFTAAAERLPLASGTVSSATPAAPAAPVVESKKPGRPKAAAAAPAAPAVDDLGEGDDLNAAPAVDDGLGDDGLGDAPAAAPAVTQADVRNKLLALKAKDGNNPGRAQKVMVKFINDAAKQPTVPNVPADQYGALVKFVDGLLAK